MVIDPFFLPYTMPDQTTRRAFWDRVRSERFRIGKNEIHVEIADLRGVNP